MADRWHAPEKELDFSLVGLDELTEARRRLLARGHSRAEVAGFLDFAIGLVTGQPAPMGSDTRAKYRKMLRVAFGDGEPPGPAGPTTTRTLGAEEGRVRIDNVIRLTARLGAAGLVLFAVAHSPVLPIMLIM